LFYKQTGEARGSSGRMRGGIGYRRRIADRIERRTGEFI